MPAMPLTKVEAEARARLVSNVDYHVALELSDDLTRPTFLSVTDVDFDASSAGAATFIELAAAGVREIELNGRRLPLTAFDSEAQRLALTGLLVGRNHLRVVADAEYHTDGVGLHRKADPSDGRVYLYSHFEPYDAHRVYACFDQPDIKAHFTLEVTAPDDWAVLANEGLLDRSGRHSQSASVTDLGDGRRTVSFASTKLLPPYLTAVGAGEYYLLHDSHNGLPLALAVRESQRAVLDNVSPWMFRALREQLDVYARRDVFGFPYQFAQYVQAFVPEFNVGAMENPGLTTFNDSMIPTGRLSHSQLRRLYAVMAHEMGHEAGFGDVVTMAFWDDLHLNETFATVMEYYVMSKSKEFGDDAWIEMAQTEKALALAQDQLPTTHPVKADVSDTGEVDLLFDQITYAKGASVIRQLLALIGDDAFFTGVRQYFHDHWFGNATQADFLGAIGAAAGRDLTAWGEEWMGAAGVNTLTPSLRTDHRGLVTSMAIGQTAVRSAPTLRTHRVNVGIYDLDAQGRLVRRASLAAEISGARTAVTDPRLIGQPRPALVVVNDGDLTYAKVRFDDVSMKTLRDHLGDIQDPLTRTVCWSALWDMTRDAQISATDLIALAARHLPGETNVAILERQLSQLMTAANEYAAPAHRAAARTALADVAQTGYATADPGSEIQLAWLRGYIDAATTDKQFNHLERLLNGSARVNGVNVAGDDDLRWLIVGRLAAGGKFSEAQIHGEALRHGKPGDVTVRRELAANAARPDAAIKQRVFDRALHDTTLPLASIRAMVRGEAVAGRFMGGINQPGQEALLAGLAKPYFEAIPELWKSRDPVVAKDITTLLYPATVVSPTTVAAAGVALRRSLPYSARRILLEQRDRTERALRAQTLDRHARQRADPHDGLAA